MNPNVLPCCRSRIIFASSSGAYSGAICVASEKRDAKSRSWLMLLVGKFKLATRLHATAVRRGFQTEFCAVSFPKALLSLGWSGCATHAVQTSSKGRPPGFSPKSEVAFRSRRTQLMWLMILRACLATQQGLGYTFDFVSLVSHVRSCEPGLLCRGC